ncbi:aldehyde dehydrogenase family protein [bacterium]|nr:aldehyde dehydrogenase family protein [bacterium]
MTSLFEKKHVVSVNPATRQRVGEVAATPAARVEEIVRLAREGFDAWKTRPLVQRAGIMKRAQQLLLDRSESFAELITLEMGRPFTESLSVELEASVDLIGYYAARSRKFLSERRLPLHNVFFMRRKSLIHYQPLGVMGIISPWNWSLLIPLGSIVPALFAGNSIVFKPSELTPLVGEKIQELFLDAGVPESVFQLIQGDGHVGAALVRSGADKVFFTGSTDVGQKVMETAARNLKPVVLEMGGSDPAIVCADADLEITAAGILWGAFNNCGQNCNSIERVYVHASVYPSFLELMTRKISHLQVGNGMEPGVDIGPLASEAQLHKIEKLVHKAVKDGAHIHCGGNPFRDMEGYFFQPTILTTEEPLISFHDEELFGPLVMVTPFQDEEEAVRFANQSAFGLAASVWTRNRKNGLRLARQIESGTVMINDAVVSFGMTEAGWTGVKKSGIGWVHGEKGLDEMVNMQYINHDPQFRMQKIWWFPYTPSVSGAMKAGMHFLFHRNWWKKLRAIPKVLRCFAPYLLLNSRRKEKL